MRTDGKPETEFWPEALILTANCCLKKITGEIIYNVPSVRIKVNKGKIEN